MREHIHHAGLAQGVAGHVDQDAGIARQRRRAARHVHDTLGQQLRMAGAQFAQRYAQRHGAVARRVYQHAVEFTQRDQVVGRHFEQVAGVEGGLVRQAVGLGVVQRAFGQRSTALDADHFAALRGQRQREVTQAAEQVGHAVLRLYFQQTQGLVHQHAVDIVVHLGEIDRLERHLDAEFRQHVVQLRADRVERCGRLRPLGLQPDLDLVLVGEGLELGFVVGRHRRHDAEHQRGQAFADGDFDLRDLVVQGGGADQRAQRQQHVRHVARQDLATVDVCHEGRFLFVEANQHGLLLDHVAHRQARAVAVAPGRAVHRPHDVFRTDLADVAQVIFQHALLDRDLRARLQVLH